MDELKDFEIGEKLKELRKASGLTQAQLAEEVGLSKSAIIQYENNVRRPNFEALAKLENYFNNFSPAYLTGGGKVRLPGSITFSQTAKIINKCISDDIKVELEISNHSHDFSFFMLARVYHAQMQENELKLSVALDDKNEPSSNLYHQIRLMNNSGFELVVRPSSNGKHVLLDTQNIREAPQGEMMKARSYLFVLHCNREWFQENFEL